MDDVAMQPGPELDALVAQAMGWQLSDRGFYVKGVDQAESHDTPDNWKPSTDPAAAMRAWAWLEKNKPWNWGTLALTRDYDNIPSVVFRSHQAPVIITGETYPHAIALTVIQAGNLIAERLRLSFRPAL